MVSTYNFDQDVYLNFAIQSVMTQIKECYLAKQQLTEDILSSLYALFPLHAVSALDLVDHHSVSLVSSPSDRRIYSCTGSSGTPYLIPYAASFCTCPSYRRILKGDLIPWCKHLLATHLTIATETLQTRQVSEDVMISMLRDLMLD